MAENRYQAYIIKKLYRTFPGCLVLKNDSGYIQGIPDLTVLWFGPCWAVLEVKDYRDAPEQPNQAYYIETLGEMSFTAFIHPDNEQEVFDAMEQAFAAGRNSRVP